MNVEEEVKEGKVMDVWERLKMCFIGRFCGNGYSMVLVPGDTPFLA